MYVRNTISTFCRRPGHVRYVDIRQHALEIRHYSHVFPRMRSVCQHHITYLQRMPSVSITYASYAGIRRKVLSMLKLLDAIGVIRRIATYLSVILTYTTRTHNVPSVWAKMLIRWQSLANTSRCDRALTSIVLGIYCELALLLEWHAIFEDDFIHRPILQIFII